MNIKLIAAVDNNGLIGVHNRLPWHIPEDLKRFKALTKGFTVIMGRLTWESLPVKPLPDRRNIVVSSDLDFFLRNAVNAYDLSDALSVCDRYSDVFVIGGQRLFEEAIKLADTVYLTRVDTAIQPHESARYFPTEYLVEHFTSETTGKANGFVLGEPVKCQFQTWTRS